MYSQTKQSLCYRYLTTDINYIYNFFIYILIIHRKHQAPKQIFADIHTNIEPENPRPQSQQYQTLPLSHRGTQNTC